MADMSKCIDCPVYESAFPNVTKRMQCCQETAAEMVERVGMFQPPPPTPPPGPKIGQSVQVGGRVGVVCEPHDPKRSGTFQSAKYGPVPVKFMNRDERRAEAAKARAAR